MADHPVRIDVVLLKRRQRIAVGMFEEIIRPEDTVEELPPLGGAQAMTRSAASRTAPPSMQAITVSWREPPIELSFWHGRIVPTQVIPRPDVEASSLYERMSGIEDRATTTERPLMNL